MLALWINVQWWDSISSTPTRCLAELGIFSDNLLLQSYTTRPFSLMHPKPEEKQWTLFAAEVRNTRRFTLTSQNSSSKFTTFFLYPQIILNLMLLRKMFNLERHLLSTFRILEGPTIAVLHAMLHYSVISSLNEDLTFWRRNYFL